MTKQIPPPSAFISCLKLFQEYPEQFPPDLRLKFCDCKKSNDRQTSNDQQIDVIRTINYLITHPEKIPIKAVQRLWKVTASLSSSPSKPSPLTRMISPMSIRHSKDRRSAKRLHSPRISVSTDQLSSKDMRRKTRLKRRGSSSAIRTSKKTIRRNHHHSIEQPLQTSSKMNLPSTVIAQPLTTKETIVKDQPIPFAILRLCCPPGMIPLTAKIAKRLAIHINTSPKQSNSRDPY